MNNEDKFDQFIRDLPQMKALQEEKEMLLTSKSLAEYNLSQVGDYFMTIMKIVMAMIVVLMVGPAPHFI